MSITARPFVADPQVADAGGLAVPGVLDERGRRRVGKEPDAGAERARSAPPTRSLRQGGQRVLGRDLGEQAEPVRHPVDVAVVGDDVVEVEDVEVVEADGS